MEPVVAWTAGRCGAPERKAPAPAATTGRNWRRVAVTVDSYVFQDAIGKDAKPDEMFAPRDAAWPVRLEPAAFEFEDGELFRDVRIIVEAPDGPGPAERFNVNAHQGGVAVGGVTIIVERGG
jgi:hypothetical protein